MREVQIRSVRDVMKDAAAYADQRRVRRKRIKAGVVALAVAVGGGTAVRAAVLNKDGSNNGDCPTYVVQAGDKVWNIAREIDPNGDPRPLSDKILKINNEKAGDLQVGDELKLPC